MANCKACGASIYWKRTQNGKSTPMNLDHSSHWGTCPNAKDFRQSYKAKKSTISSLDASLDRLINDE